MYIQSEIHTLSIGQESVFYHNGRKVIKTWRMFNFSNWKTKCVLLCGQTDIDWEL